MQQIPEPEPQLIDLREFVGVLRRRKWSVILVAITIVGLALALVWRRPPMYTASARVEVRPLTAQASQYGYYDLQSSMDTEAQRVSSAQIAAQAYALGAPEGSQASASVPANTTFLEISCTKTSPEDAQACANGFAEAYSADRAAQATEIYRAAAQPLLDAISRASDRISELEGNGASESDPEVVQARSEIDTARLQLLLVPSPMGKPAVIAVPAELPTSPSNKGYITTGILAMIVGLALGVGSAFVRERLDERIGGRQDMEKALRAPVLAVVPRVPGWRNRNDAKIVAISAPTSAASEAYRTARTSLLYLAKEGGLQAIAVTGPGQGEGKTTSVVNLAVSLAQAGKRVIAVSCDLRRPRMHRFLNISNENGLSDVLTGRVDVKSALVKTAVPGLIVMPSGHVPHNPSELLGSSTMDDLLAELRNIADIVLLDTPPSLVVADALEIAPKADGVLVVADASTTPRSSLLHLTSQIERVGGTVIGAILNNFDSSTARYYEPYGKYYGGGDSYQPRSEVNGAGVGANGTENGSSNGAAPREDSAPGVRQRSRISVRRTPKTPKNPAPPTGQW